MSATKFIVRTAVVLLLAVGAASMLLPVIWMALAAFKPLAEVMQVPPTFLPRSPTLQNFVSVFNRVPFKRYFFNSVLVSFIGVVSLTFTSAAAGYALAKFSFRGSTAIFFVFIGSLVVPFQTRMIALYQLAVGLHLTNTIVGVSLPFLVDAFGIFVMRQYIVGIPDELLQAARVDSASELRIFFSIVLPLATPALATVAILTFLNSWQEFLWPLIVTDNDTARTLPVGLQSFATQYSSNVNLQMAGAVLTTIPLIVVFLIFQRRIIEGVAISGLK